MVGRRIVKSGLVLYNLLLIYLNDGLILKLPGFMVAAAVEYLRAGVPDLQ
jgi:hypothetical protein